MTAVKDRDGQQIEDRQADGQARHQIDLIYQTIFCNNAGHLVHIDNTTCVFFDLARTMQHPDDACEVKPGGPCSSLDGFDQAEMLDLSRRVNLKRSNWVRVQHRQRSGDTWHGSMQGNRVVARGACHNNVNEFSGMITQSFQRMVGIVGRCRSNAADCVAGLQADLGAERAGLNYTRVDDCFAVADCRPWDRRLYERRIPALHCQRNRLAEAVVDSRNHCPAIHHWLPVNRRNRVSGMKPNFLAFPARLDQANPGQDTA